MKKNIFDLAIYNNKKKIFKIPISTSSLAKPNKKEFFKNIKINLNKKPEYIISNFENEIRKYHNSKYCVSFCNGFWALVHTINILKIKKKKHALLPSMTYRRLADVCSWANLVPKFCEINKYDLAINVSDVEQKINKNSAILLAVNPMVANLDYKKLKKINKKIPVLVDNVEKGNFWNTSISKKFTQIYSLHASKLLNGAEGGYVLTNSFEVYSKLLDARGNFEKNNSGFNLNPLHALVAVTNLKEIKLLIQHNKKIFLEYKKQLKYNKFFKLIDHNLHNPNYKMILVRLKKKVKIHRDNIIKILNSENILARSYYRPPLHKKKMGYKFIAKNLKTTNKEKDKYLILPSGYKTRSSDVKKVVYFLNFIMKHQNYLR